MKLIKPSFEILKPQGNDLNGIYKHIELCGRTCYHSTDRIDNDSAEPFVDRMIEAGHHAMLEHGTFYLKVYAKPRVGQDPLGHYTVSEETMRVLYEKYSANHYSRCVMVGDSELYITTNFRVIVGNGWVDDVAYLCNPTEHHIKRVTVKFICNRQVWNEFIRHRELQRMDGYDFMYLDYDAERNFSFAQESTRYCNYASNKFGKELTFIEPCWFNDDGITEWSKNIFLNKLRASESGYLALLEEGWKPQQAALVLPNDIKTELVMTGFVDDTGWKNFFQLRAIGTTGAPHPQAKELAEPLMQEFVKENLL